MGEYADDPGDSVEKIEAIDEDGNTRTLAAANSGETLYSPSWSPEEDDVAYVRKVPGEGDLDAGEIDLMVSGDQITDGEDVFVFTPEWLSASELLYSADGAIREREIGSGAIADIPFIADFEVPTVDYDHKSYDFDERGSQNAQGILTPALSPDGKHIAFIALNDLWVMRIGRPPQRITDDSYYKTDPAWSPDGRYIAYSSDEGGTQDLYAYDTETGDTQQVTSLDYAVVSAAWSPDGSQIAFQNQDRATLTVEMDVNDDGIETGDVREVVGELFLPGRPTWSEDGSVLALAALQQYSDRFRSGSSLILTVDLESGEENYYPPGEEFTSLSTRGGSPPRGSEQRSAGPSPRAAASRSLAGQPGSRADISLPEKG